MSLPQYPFSTYHPRNTNPPFTEMLSSIPSTTTTGWGALDFNCERVTQAPLLCLILERSLGLLTSQKELHLFRDSATKPSHREFGGSDRVILAVLAVPSWMTPSGFLGVCGSSGGGYGAPSHNSVSGPCCHRACVYEET